VVDFDVHHGNGTEEIARAWHAKHRKAGYNGGADDSDLFFASIHLADDGAAAPSIEFYPGTGVQDDLHHNIVNVCVPPMWTGAGGGGRGSVSASGGRVRSAPKKNRDDELDGSGKSLTSVKAAEAAAAAANPQGGRAEWMKRLRERVLPPLRAFKPDLLIISAGFDAANHDVGNAGVDKTGKRLAGINLQPDDYEEMTAYLCAAAGSSNARVVSVLEGGYGYLTGDAKDGAAGLIREGLASCVVGHVRALAGLGAPVLV
jgi:acetoin utilization deacetylase AcuC-like enzyme